jgi:hypothetical protein
VVIAGGGGLGVEEMIGVERGRGVDRHEKGMNENGVIKPSRSVRI